MNLEMKKLAWDADARDLHLILRMSGKTQNEVAKTLHITRQQISAEEQEPRYRERQALLASFVANAVLPRSVKERHFSEPEQIESDLDRLKRKIYVG